MAQNIDRILIGNTVRITWVQSGAIPSQITAAVYADDSTIVSSASMTGSGNGHYYRDYTVPGSAGFYFAETVSWVNSFPYVNRLRFQTVIEGSS